MMTFMQKTLNFPRTLAPSPLRKAEGKNGSRQGPIKKIVHLQIVLDKENDPKSLNRTPLFLTTLNLPSILNQLNIAAGPKKPQRWLDFS